MLPAGLALTAASAPRRIVELKIGLILVVLISIAPCIGRSDEQIVVDPAAAHHSFPHFWEQMFGWGRAILTLRESYRRDLRAVKQATDFKFVRFHATQHDGLCWRDEHREGGVDNIFF